MLRKAYNKVRMKTRQNVLLPVSHKQVTFQVRFITGFASQHREVRQILEKHWGLLLADAKVSNFVSLYPQITFRKIPVFTRSWYPATTLGRIETTPVNDVPYCMYL